MKKESSSELSGSARRLASWSPWVVLLLFLLLFLLGHSLMPYSDPNHWINRAMRMEAGEPVLRRVPLFPLYLIGAMKVLDHAWIFLANIPWLLALLGGGMLLVKYTMRADHRASAPWARAWIACGGVLFAFLFFLADPQKTMRLINPYRDPAAVAMLFFGFLAYLRSEDTFRWGWGFLGGLCLGLSTGFRETMFLCFLPLALLGLCRGIRHWTVKQARVWIVLVALGGVIGISPILVQNYLYSGRALVPAYSAKYVLQQEGMTEADLHDRDKKFENAEVRIDPKVKTEVKWRLDRLIPGVDFDFFGKHIDKAIKLVRKNLHTVGEVFLVIGVLAALVYRNRIVLGVLLPAGVINVLFYACYRYVKWRYLFTANILFFLIAAYGGGTSVRWICRLLMRPKFTRPFARTLPVAGLVGLWLLLGGYIAAWLTVRPSEMRAWHVKDFQREMQHRLEAPRMFVGFYHHRELLAWLVDEGFNHRPLGSEIVRRTHEEKGLDAALYEMAQTNLAFAANMNLYVHDEHHLPALTEQWLDTERLFSMRDLEMPPYRYHKPLEGDVFRLKPWSASNKVWRVEANGAGKAAVLMVDARRLWDIPEREQARLYINGSLLAARVENGPRFYDVPENLLAEKTWTLALSSDSPVPAKVLSHVWHLDEEFKLEMGLSRGPWYQHLLSPSLTDTSPLRSQACMLWGSGEVDVPFFASTNRMAYAEFRVEFYQEDAAVKNRLQVMRLDGTTQQLPPKRQQARYVVPLGQGTGRLAWHRVVLETDLGSREEQQAMAVAGTLEDWRFVKIFDVRVFSYAPQNEERFHLVCGDRDAGVYLRSGVYAGERHNGKYPVRWTNGQALLEVPLQDTGMDRELRIRYFCPETIEPGVNVIWNGKPLANGKEVMDGETKERTLTFVVPASRLADGGDVHTVEIGSSTWSPHQEGVIDHRVLGIMLHKVEVE